MYEDEEVAITKWLNGLKKGEHYYQIIAKDDAMKRSGNGYLLLSPGAMQRMCQAISNMVF